LSNNSHGDAGMAAIDPDFRLVAAVNRQAETFRLVEQDLDAYFVPKKEIALTRAYLEQLGRSLGYKKTAWAYLFERIA
jgi:hypothetical protein